MLSRVAESLYWMSRYLERAEHTARVLGVQLNLMLEQDPRSSDRRWHARVGSLGHPGSADARTAIHSRGAQTYALRISPAASRWRAKMPGQVREQISSEMWEQFNRLFHEVKRMESAGFWTAQPLRFSGGHCRKLAPGARRHRFHHESRRRLAIHPGRGDTLSGQAPSRACWTPISTSFAPEQPMDSAEHMEWIGLLRSCTAFEAYCKVYTADLRPERVAEFLLLNGEFPHSVRFAADHLQRSLEAINQAAASKRSPRVAKIAGRLEAPDSCSRHWKKSSRRSPRFLPTSSGNAPAFTPRSTKSISLIRWRRPSRLKMYYSIRHVTKFRYSDPVSESLMEARMQPRSEGSQRCLSFQLMVQPKARVQFYRDYLGNTVHHFDVPGRHRQLSIVADALVDVQPARRCRLRSARRLG